MKHRKSALRRHTVAVLIILVLSVVIGFAFSGALTLLERVTHPREYREFVECYAAEYGVPESIVYAVIKSESGFDSSAVSRVGAIGLMQIMPDTFEWLTSLTGEECETGLLYDPETNIRYGTYLLSILYRSYGRWETAYAAYNAGMGNVNEWLDTPEYTDENGVLVEIPFKETRSYVRSVTAAREVYERLYDL